MSVIRRRRSSYHAMPARLVLEFEKNSIGLVRFLQHKDLVSNSAGNEDRILLSASDGR